MIAVYEVSQIRAAELAAMCDGMCDGMPGELMRRASYGLAMHCLQLLREIRSRVHGSRVVLLVGKGGNGADALYAGEVLLRRGVAVTALLARPGSADGGALRAFERAGGQTSNLTTDSAATIEHSDLVIDGIVGLASGRRLDLPTAIAKQLAIHPGIVAVDVPSGINVNSGAVAPDALRVRKTVTFGALKNAHVLAPARDYCGEIALVDIGVRPYLPVANVALLTDADVAAQWPRPSFNAHKYSTGTVGIVAGSSQYRGAAVLSVGGAVRAKPGMVRYVGPPECADQVIAQWPEAVLGDSIAESPRTTAWVVGPGLGTDARAGELVDQALACDVPVLFDADALRLLAGRRDALAARTAPTVLTPHAGEFARLFGEPSEPLAGARRAAADCGAIVLLKGPTTVIAAPDGTAYVTTSGTSRLATAGSGDVLAGIIGALLSAGGAPALAAAVGAHAHGRAAEIAGGPIVAHDLPDLLRTYLGAMGS